MGKALEGILFDLDGVIADTARFHYLAWKRLADELGIPFDEMVNQRLKGIDRRRSFQIILEAADVRIPQKDQDRYIALKNDYYLQLIAGMSPKDILPGAADLLEYCRRQGILIGLASASRNAGFVLEKLGLTATFDAVADASLVKRGKPDPEIFLTVMTTLDLTPESCLGVEDALEGVRAINAAGMFSIGVGDSNLLKEADDVIPDLTVFNLRKYQELFLTR